jgi:hypothetical protein
MTPKIVSEARSGFCAINVPLYCYPPQEQTHEDAKYRVDDPTVAHGHPRKRRRINGTADSVRSKSEGTNKSSAELKVTALYPKDSTSSPMPSGASASSSTIEINGGLDIPVPEETPQQTKTAMERQFLFKEFDLAQLAGG